MDTELFELCKDVYEKKGWRSAELTEHFMNHDGNTVQMSSYKGAYYDQSYKYVCPLYTSDYLLGKLPNGVTVSNANGNWGAWIADRSENTLNESDTPLKALLKLTIALCEAGELK